LSSTVLRHYLPAPYTIYNLHHSSPPLLSLFFFNDTSPSEIYTLSLHDALPICYLRLSERMYMYLFAAYCTIFFVGFTWYTEFILDRKSTRLNSSHVSISYAVFCLKKKKKQ